MIQRPFKLAEWLIQPDRRQLSNAEQSITVEPKTMAVLVYLASHPGVVVSTDDIISNVWGENPVSDNPVYKCVAKLRKILGDNAKTPEYIETIPKTGYRLVAKVTPATSVSSQPARMHYIKHFAFILMVTIVMLVVYSFNNHQSASTKTATQQHISAFSGSHKSASFSPDETHIVFASTANSVSHIWRMALGSKSPEQLTFGHHLDSRPRWSPNGIHVLFVRNGDLWSVPAQGGKARQVIQNGYNPNWSADGLRFVFERKGEIWIANADGSKQYKVEGLPTVDLLLAPRMPALSPDGQTVAFFHAIAGPLGDIWIISSKGGSAKRLTFDTSIGGAPSWTADGSSIIFSSQRSGTKTLWRIPAEGGEPIAILQGAGEDDEPEISQSGKRIIYSHIQQRFILMSTDLNTGEEKEMVESWQVIAGPTLSPDGTTIAYFNITPAGFVKIFTVPVGGGTPKLITQEENTINAVLQWSFDGKAIYFYRIVPEMSFRKVPAEGGLSTKIVDDWNWNVEHGAHVDSSGRFIVYSRLDRGIPIATMIRNIKTGEEKVFNALLDRPRWSKNGEWIIGGNFKDANEPEGEGVILCAYQNADCRQLTDVGLLPQWSQDESKIYFVRAFPKGQTLWMMDAKTETVPEQISTMEPILPIGNFYDITTDNHVFWVRLEQSDSELWQMDLSTE